MKERLDVLLVEKGFAASREKAKAIIMSGAVFVDGQREDKAGASFDREKARIEVKGSTLKYVRISALPRAALRTVCCKTGQQKYMR